MSITNAARRFEQRFDAKAERFIWHHPLLGFFFIFIGMPLFVLLGVCISNVIPGNLTVIRRTRYSS